MSETLPTLADITSRFATAPLPPGVKPPRPPNSWILYRSWKTRNLPSENALRKQCDISQHISEMWKQEDEGIRAYFYRLAEEAGHAHQLAYPGYRYQPAPRIEKKTRAKGKGGTKNSKGSRGIGSEVESRNRTDVQRPGHPYLLSSSQVQNYNGRLGSSHLLSTVFPPSAHASYPQPSANQRQVINQFIPASVQSRDTSASKPNFNDRSFNVSSGHTLAQSAVDVSCRYPPFGHDFNFYESKYPISASLEDRPGEVEVVVGVPSYGSGAANDQYLFPTGWQLPNYNGNNGLFTEQDSYVSPGSQSSSSGGADDWDWSQYTHNLDS